MQLHQKLSTAAAFLALALAVVLLSGCNLSLAGDVTPPPNYIEPTELPANPASGVQQASAATVFPLVPPDPSQGAAIYSEKCLPCHGTKGMGDGAQAANLPNQPAPIGSPDFAHSARPVDWFRWGLSRTRWAPKFSS